MMPQMEAGEPMSEQSSTTYGRYEGNRAETQQQYEAPYGQSQQDKVIDDDFVEAVAQRLVQRLAQGAGGKAYPQSPMSDKNVLRVILAVVSMLMLVLFAFLLVIVVGGSFGWLSFCAACAAIFLIAVVAIDKVK